ncbi:MAG: metallophosphoesterase [Kofleriaceae bacterium]
MAEPLVTDGGSRAPPSRTLVMGDPQASFDTVMAVLARHGALIDGRLASDVDLITIGDHFDYGSDDPVAAGREGLRVTRWLAGHPNATLVLGNHDAARVMELIAIDDARFATARTLASAIAETKRTAGPDAAGVRERDEFAIQFPELAVSGLAGRDYATFCVEQRELVIELLLAGRFRLAVVGALIDGRAALLTHAGITRRELTLLGMPDERDPHVIAATLNRHLARAIDAVRPDWKRGIATALSLEPIHVMGRAGLEGGGLLYHRPTNPDRPNAKLAELSSARPRRFDPRALPDGLVQIAGHTGHHKCVEELGGWVGEAARQRERGGIRTLRVVDNIVSYDLGIAVPRVGAADLIMIDGEMRRVDPSQVDLLPLAAVM